MDLYLEEKDIIENPFKGSLMSEIEGKLLA
jgi:hypothetical protein